LIKAILSYRYFLSLKNNQIIQTETPYELGTTSIIKRQGDTSKRLRIEQDDTRLGFEVDYDRIFSAAFRSLQDKTQVIPLSKIDFVHTRLTHSLEVSVVGRS
jgi:dGTP triphosphohydrolase